MPDELHRIVKERFLYTDLLQHEVDYLVANREEIYSFLTTHSSHSECSLLIKFLDAHPAEEDYEKMIRIVKEGDSVINSEIAKQLWRYPCDEVYAYLEELRFDISTPLRCSAAYSLEKSGKPTGMLTEIMQLRSQRSLGWSGLLSDYKGQSPNSHHLLLELIGSQKSTLWESCGFIGRSELSSLLENVDELFFEDLTKIIHGVLRRVSDERETTFRSNSLITKMENILYLAAEAVEWSLDSEAIVRPTKKILIELNNTKLESKSKVNRLATLKLQALNVFHKAGTDKLLSKFLN